MNKQSFHIISLGCAKNAVDSDSMTQLLTKAGYVNVDDPNQADILIVNTCGFIDLAREESFNVLAGLTATKKNNQVLIAAGCLTQCYGEAVAKHIAGIDAVIGTRCWMDIVGLVEKMKSVEISRPYYHLPEATTMGSDEHRVLRATVQGASAYLKIADGCRHTCAFCAIPLIKGAAVSRSVEAILADACVLQSKGVREIILIAQDTTDYGQDLGLNSGLVYLLRQLIAAVPQVDWIRVMYAYPGSVTDELIDVMANSKQVVPYLDIPLQHAHPDVLRRMHRPSNIRWIHQTLLKMRKVIPGLAIRTTFIVGYPGETESEFQTLLNFVGEMRFDRVGVFKYSFEKGTPAEPLGDPIPDNIKEDRLKRLMVKQQHISLERNKEFIGQKLNVLIEGSGQGVSIGRSYRDAPEIDGLVLVKGKIPSGQIIPVKITDASIYDLTGVCKSG